MKMFVVFLHIKCSCIIKNYNLAATSNASTQNYAWLILPSLRIYFQQRGRNRCIRDGLPKYHHALSEAHLPIIVFNALIEG